MSREDGEVRKDGCRMDSLHKKEKKSVFASD